VGFGKVAGVALCGWCEAGRYGVVSSWAAGVAVGVPVGAARVVRCLGCCEGKCCSCCCCCAEGGAVCGGMVSREGSQESAGGGAGNAFQRRGVFGKGRGVVGVSHALRALWAGRFRGFSLG